MNTHRLHQELRIYLRLNTMLAQKLRTALCQVVVINGEVEDSVLFKEVYIGNNCTIRNSIILNEVYIGDNTYIENCIVESHGTIRANSNYVGSPDDVKIIQERNERYVM